MKKKVTLFLLLVFVFLLVLSFRVPVKAIYYSCYELDCATPQGCDGYEANWSWCKIKCFNVVGGSTMIYCPPLM